MECKDAFSQLGSKLDSSLEEYNKSAGKKVMVIPKDNGETFYIFNRKTVVISAQAGKEDSLLLEYYKGQKGVQGHAFETSAEFTEKEELKCYTKDEAFFSFTTAAEKEDTEHMVKSILGRIFRGCIPV